MGIIMSTPNILKKEGMKIHDEMLQPGRKQQRIFYRVISKMILSSSFKRDSFLNSEIILIGY